MKDKLLIVLVLALALIQPLFAGDSVSIGMSCTIPSIPGINAPPFPEEQTNNSFPGEIQVQIVEDKMPEKPAMIEEQSQREIVLADGTINSKRVQTVYSR